MANNDIFSLTKTNIKSAIVFAILTALVAMIVYIVGLGDIFKIEPHTIANIGVMAILNGILSLLKSFLTTSSGQFLGMTKVTEAKQVVN